MLKSIIQLIPFGWDEDARVISGFYIANVGLTEGYNYEGNFDYVAAYFERASKFSNYKQIARVRFITDWNNNQSTLHLMHEIFREAPHEWWNISDLNSNTGMTAKEIQAIEIFKQRAIEDGIYE